MARRAIAAAGALWREGLVPESHTQMAGALRMALAPWARVGGETASPRPAATDEERAFAALGGAGYRNLDRLRHALSATSGVAGDSVASTPPSDFEWIWGEAERLYRFGARHLATPFERRRKRVRMASAAVLGVLLVIVGIVRIWVRPHVSASAVFSPDFPASYAIDDIESTEWLLPERTAGWLLVSFSSPRHVHRVVVLNGHNRFYLDRGAERIRVTAFSKNGPVGSVEGSFARITADRSALELPLDAEGVSEVRVDVLSFFGLGAALAEVEIR
jgi:hypothetical protein